MQVPAYAIDEFGAPLRQAQVTPLVLGDERTLDESIDHSSSALGIVRTYESFNRRSVLMRRHDGDERRRPLREIVEHERNLCILVAGMRPAVRLEPLRHLRHVLTSSRLANASHTLAPSASTSLFAAAASRVKRPGNVITLPDGREALARRVPLTRWDFARSRPPGRARSASTRDA